MFDLKHAFLCEKFNINTIKNNMEQFLSKQKLVLLKLNMYYVAFNLVFQLCVVQIDRYKQNSALGNFISFLGA